MIIKIIYIGIIILLCSCKAENVPPEYVSFLEKLSSNFGDPQVLYKKRFRGKDSITVAVFVFNKNVNIESFAKEIKFTIHHKTGEDDLSAHWLHSTLWSEFCQQDEQVAKIHRNGFGGNWIIGFNHEQPNPEKFMIYTKSGRSYFLYQINH